MSNAHVDAFLQFDKDNPQPIEFGDDEYDYCPFVDLDFQEAIQLIQVWREYQGGGMGGVGHLPRTGGSLDQPAVLMDSLMAMSAIEQEDWLKQYKEQPATA